MIESFYFFIHPLNRFYKIHSLKSVTLVTAVASMGFQDFQGFMDQLAQVQPLAFRYTKQRLARFGDSKEPRQPSHAGKRADSVSFMSCSERGTLSFLNLRVSRLLIVFSGSFQVIRFQDSKDSVAQNSQIQKASKSKK